MGEDDGMNDREPRRSALRPPRVRRDLIAGAVLAAVGAFAIAVGVGYGFGSLRHVGSGTFPVLFGGLLILCGVLIAADARPAGVGPVADTEDGPLSADTHGDAGEADKRLLGCVIGGMALFALLAERAGFVIATLLASAIVFAGNSRSTPRETATFAVCLTAGTVLLFQVLLGLQLPLLGSWFGAD